MADKNGDRWEEDIDLCEDGDRKQARLLAARLARDDRTFSTPPFSEQLYGLDRSAMTYGPGGEEALNALLLRKLKVHHSRREIREIEKKIWARLYEEDFQKAQAIPLANGDLSVRPMELLEPSPKGHFLVRSKAEWDPDAGCPAFKRFLRATVPARVDRQVFQDYTGYCLLHWDRPVGNRHSDPAVAMTITVIMVIQGDTRGREPANFQTNRRPEEERRHVDHTRPI